MEADLYMNQSQEPAEFNETQESWTQRELPNANVILDKWYTRGMLTWFTRERRLNGNDDSGGLGHNDKIITMPTDLMLDSLGLTKFVTHVNWSFMLVAINVVSILSCVCHMMGHGSSHGSSRTPPAWAPDMEPRYTFAMWQREILLWTIANSDLEPHRQAALVLQQLKGGARELTRDLPMQVIMNGALLNGVQVDGVTYIMNILAERYGQLGEELRLKVIKEFMDFDRKPHESIDDLLTRFEVVRNRATELGNFDMSFEGISYMLLRSTRVTDQQFLMLTQPTNGRLPNDEPAYRNLFTALRRLGHVVEHHQDNIASGLRGKGSGKGSKGMYLGYEVSEPSYEPVPEAAYPQWNVSESTNSWNEQTWTRDPWSSNPASSSYHETTGWNLSEWTPEPVYATAQEADSGTDTDTQSSVGEFWYEYEDIPNYNELAEPQQAEELFWAYQKAKGRYRRFMRKPVRRVRRFMKRKGKGKGKHPGFYLASLSDHELEQMFFAKGKSGKSKGKGKRSSGKGKGRRTNPKGPDGQIMKCRKCGSIEHFQRECPRNSGGPRPQGPPGNPSFYVESEPMHIENSAPLNLPVTARNSRIVEIVGNQERPVDAPNRVRFTFYNEYQDVPIEDGVRTLKYFVLGEHDPAQVPVDPWNEYLSNPQSSQQSLFTREQFEQHMNRNRGTLLEGTHVPTVSMASGSSDQLPVPKATVAAPLWTTFANAQSAVGNRHWTPYGERNPYLPAEYRTEKIVVPMLYRNDFENIEPMHESIVTNFLKRLTPCAPQAPTGIYKNNDSRMDSHQWKVIEQCKELQDHLKTLRNESVRKSKRIQKAKLAAENAFDGGINPFDGSVNKCVICLELFACNESVSRLVCRHVFHETCLAVYLSNANSQNPTCPECRGSTVNPKNFLYIHENQFVVTDSSGDEENPRSGRRTHVFRNSSTTVNLNPASKNPANGTSSLSSSVSIVEPEVFLPFWQTEDSKSADTICYHSNSVLRDGRQGLLIDPGACSNLAGENWIQEMATKALAAGHNVAQGKLEKPLHIAGVGKGTDKAEWEVHVPIALVDCEGNGGLHEFHAPVVGGTGKILPALLGLQSMSRQNSVLEMAIDHEYLTLPGPGGYTINWSPGTVRYKLERAVSGHLLLPCDKFDKVSKETGGLYEPTLTFFGEGPRVTPTREMGTQTDTLDEPQRKQVPRKNNKNS